MKPRIGLLLLFLLLLLPLFAGCTLNRPTREIRFYTLEYPAPEVEGLSPLTHVLRVAPFQVAPEYNTTRMVYRDGDYTRSFYHYHKWRANPGDLVAFFLARDLRQANLFRAVFAPDGGLRGDYVLEGLVGEFLEHDAEDRWEAVLTLHVSLLKENEPDVGRRVAFQKSYAVRETASPMNPPGVVAAMSRAMATASRMILLDIHQVLSH